MYGYRARIGLILPSTNTVSEPEFWRMAPAGVSIHTTRMRSYADNPEGLVKMAQHAERAADELRTCLCNVLIYACTSGSFINGREWENDLRVRLEAISGIPVVSTSSACLKAFQAFGKTKLSMASPYIDIVNEAAKCFFEKEGYSIIKMKGLGIETKLTDIGIQNPDVSFRLGREVIMPETELLFLSCTGLRSLENIPFLETDLGIPVVSSNLASMWAALRVAGVQEKLTQFGSLFAY